MTRHERRLESMCRRRIGIVGGGIGGMTTALALLELGHQVQVFEQASRFGRVGADINLTPNAVRALDGLGGSIGQRLRDHAARPTFRISRDWETGTETSRLPMGDNAENLYGAPQLTLHRADVLAALHDELPPETIELRARATGVTASDAGVTIEFADRSSQDVDLLIGADGIHSTVRGAVLGEESPEFTGVVSYRAVVPSERVAELPNHSAFTKWWGPDPATQIVTFPLTAGKETFVFATAAQESWHEESWTSPGDVAELRATYRDFHPDARALLAACDEVMKSALYVRDPLPAWSVGRVTLLGDACHPMMPFMAQGAGMAIEDSVVLARALDAHRHHGDAFAAYERERIRRTSRIQLESRSNEWLKDSGTGDWVYGYDAWSVDVSALRSAKEG